MSRLTVQLQIDEQMALAELARQERRDARNQAAVIIRRVQRQLDMDMASIRITHCLNKNVTLPHSPSWSVFGR